MFLFLKEATPSLASLFRKICSCLGFFNTTDAHADAPAVNICEDEIYPVRVINVRETLANGRGVCFSVPTDWNFHTISHTWGLKVSDWSIEVARKLGEGDHCISTSAGYNEVFRNEDFSGRSYYCDFLKFLEILASDRAEKVWFDTLCINQTDSEEKSREIQHMGAFYSHSLSCYVLTHGLGEGFGFLSRDERLPRWFSRVWTLQEFLVPRELWFIVELDVATVENTFPLTNSGGRICFRKLQSSGSSDLYFVNRFGYESLVWERFCAEEDEPEGFNMVTEEQVQLRTRLETFFSLPRRSWDADHGWIFSDLYRNQLGHITKEISSRNCAEGHEEDRLLSILALLGMEGRLPALRVGKSLEEQTLGLFKVLVEVDQSLLLALCTDSVFPYPRVGMSWFPHFFRGVGGSSRWFNNPPFFPGQAEGTEVIEASERGLKLSCRFLKSQFLPFKEHSSRCPKPLSCLSCTDDFEYRWVLEILGGGRPAFPLLDVCEDLSYLMFIVNPFQSLNSRLTFGLGESGLILNLQERINSLEGLPRFSPWLLLLGYQLSSCEGDLAKLRSSFLFMVCVGPDAHNLHKVGLIKVEEKNFGPGWDMLFSWYDQPSEKAVFTLGGFDKISLRQLQSDISTLP